MSKQLSSDSFLLRDVSILSGSAVPSDGGGVAAPIGSKYFRSGTAGDYTKTGAPDTGWTIVDAPTGIYFNVVDYGATGDGTTDDRAAIQLAIDDAAVQGGCVYFPSGTYKCGKNGANPYSFVLNNVDNLRFLGCGWGGATLVHSGSAASGAYSLFVLSGGSDSTEFEALTFDQSGLTSPGAGLCHLIDAQAANIVKIVSCRFTGGVSTAGAYVHSKATNIWIDSCDARNAYGPCVYLDTGTAGAWLIDSTLINTATSDDLVLLNDSASGGMSNIKIMDCHLENTQKYAIRATSDDTFARVQTAGNVILGYVSMTGLSRSQFQRNTIITATGSLSIPSVLFDTCTETQVQGNAVLRDSTCNPDFLILLDTCTRMQVQKNTLYQRVDDAGVVHILDCSTVQVQGNVVAIDDAGLNVADAYVVEAVSVVADNIQITHDNISATVGDWDAAVALISNGAALGNIQVVPGSYNNCDYGVYIDVNGSAANASGLLMVAGGLVQAAVGAFGFSDSGVYVRVGGNASTFGPNIIAGNGTPEGNVTARIGSAYQRMDGGAATSLYIKESGTGNTGWVGK